MKLKPILQGVLAVAIVALAILIYNSIMKPMRFDREFYIRRDACGTKLKAIRTLEEAYKLTYGVYTGSFDTLVNRLLTEDSLRIKQEIINYDKIPEDVSVSDMLKSEAIKLGYITVKEAYVNPIAQLREQGKLKYRNSVGIDCEFTDQDLKELRYVPYPKDEKQEFELQAGHIVKGEGGAGTYNVQVFECKVSLQNLMKDLDPQMVANRIAEIERVSTKYAGWKVGDMTQAITEGNFE